MTSPFIAPLGLLSCDVVAGSKIYDSPDMPDAEATFAITESNGVTDAD